MAARRAIKRVNLVIIVHINPIERPGVPHLAESKFSLDWEFLQDPHERGRATGRAWLAENYKHLGRRSSVDLRKEFL